MGPESLQKNYRKTEEAFELCRQKVRNKDPDRYFASLFAKRSTRPKIWAVYALNSELADIRQGVSEPIIGDIRLQWWVEAIEQIESETPPNHFIIKALQVVIRETNITTTDLQSLLSGWRINLNKKEFTDLTEIYDYAANTAGKLTELITYILWTENNKYREYAVDFGTAWGLVRLVKALLMSLYGENFTLPGTDTTTAPFIDRAKTIRRVLYEAKSLADRELPNYYKSIGVMIPILKNDIGNLEKVIGTTNQPASSSIFSRQLRMCFRGWFGL